MGIQIRGDTDTISAVDGSLVITGITSSSISVSAGSTSAPSISPSGDSNTGIFFPSADTIAFAEGGAEVARIDSSGRFGIGATSPDAAKLHILNGTDASFTPNTTYDALVVENGTSAQGAAIQLVAATNGVSSIGFSDSTRNVGQITYDHASDYLFINTAGVERMRIDSSGYLWLKQFSGTNPWDATSGTYAKFGDIYPIGATAQSNIVAIFNRNTTTGVLIETKYNGSVVGTISVTASATAYNTSSDYRLKENVTPVTDSITRLQQLKPSRFNFIADPDKTVDGFIAHEVQEIVPEAIHGEKDAEDEDGKPIYQGIDQSKLVPLLTAALQEAIAKIETLEAKVAALESA